MRRLAPREHRLLALFLLVLAVALGWLVLVGPVLHGFAARADARRALLFAYLRDERAIAQLGSVGRAAAEQRRTAARFRYPAPDAATATAALKTQLGESVAAAGGQLRTLEYVATDPGRVRVRVQCALSAAQIPALLRRLHVAAPLLTVDGLTISANKDAQPPLSGLLETSLDVSAAFSSHPPR